ncbi:MAG: carbohydrate ABC transporter permease [Clostridia bacterium]|nr:carbohydrate ABC transporter permease [Clostridia bacterium]
MKFNKESILQSIGDCKKSTPVKISSTVLKSVFRWFILLSIGYIVLYPLFYMITTSISTKEAFLDPTSVWIPNSVTLENFTFMYKVMDYGAALLATLRIEMVSALLEVFTCAIVAYGFARFKFPLRKILTALLFVTILIPTPMIVMPLMTNFSKLDFLGILGLFNKISGIDLRPDLLGTPWTFYLPSLFASGLKSGLLIYIYIQFFKGLPYELEEASWIDGAGPIRTFFAIAVPSSGVVILTVIVFSIIWHWNDYFMASMFMDEGYPLAVTMSKLHDLLNYNGIYLSPEKPNGLAYVLTGCLMFIIPPLIFYLIVQHWFVESIDRVGITG